MRRVASVFISHVVVFASLATPLQLAAQRTQYQLIEMPTLGGPAAMGQVDGTGISQFINNSGVVVGGVDTPVPDPFCLNPDCFIPHGFRSQDGVLSDLGALENEVNFSHATSVNARDWITGGSFMSELDPLTGQPAEHAVLWKDGKIVDLGTLGTGLESAGLYINDAGEVVGFSTFDTIPDPSSFKGAAIHAFIWRNGVMQDLGTLGGFDAFPSGGCNNQHAGLVAGSSSRSTGESHAFLWDNGTMTDIPALGGTFAGAQCANNQGEVIGQSNLAGDAEQHAFSWEAGRLTDLGTLGGSFSQAVWLNNKGQAVGGATTANDESFHATFWTKAHITDLGTLDGDCFSIANAVNSTGQIIGQSFSCPDASVSRAVLWEKGSIIDLNGAIGPDSTLQLTEPLNINDRGEIVGRGLPTGCDSLDLCGRAFVLTPCDSADAKDCQRPIDLNAQSGSAIASAMITTPGPQKTKDFLTHLRDRVANRYPIPGHRTP